MKIRKKISQIVFVVAVLSFLGAAMFFTSFNGDKTISFYENRPLAKPAQWSEEAVLTGEWGKATDAYLSDHVVARDAWLKLDTYLKCHVLQQPLIKNVVIGNNGALPICVS